MANSYNGRALISFGKQKLMPMSVAITLQTERQYIGGTEGSFWIRWGGEILGISLDTARMMMRHIGEIVNITISKGNEGKARLDLVSIQYREEAGEPRGITVKLTGIDKPPYSHLEKSNG